MMIEVHEIPGTAVAVPLRSGRFHRIILYRPRPLRWSVRGLFGEPLAGRRYWLRLPDGAVQQGVLGDDSSLADGDLPAHTQWLRLDERPEPALALPRRWLAEPLARPCAGRSAAARIGRLHIAPALPRCGRPCELMARVWGATQVEFRIVADGAGKPLEVARVPVEQGWARWRWRPRDGTPRPGSLQAFGWTVAIPGARVPVRRRAWSALDLGGDCDG